MIFALVIRIVGSQSPRGGAYRSRRASTRVHVTLDRSRDEAVTVSNCDSEAQNSLLMAIILGIVVCFSQEKIGFSCDS